MSIAIIYVTHASKEAAQEFVDTLLQERLIACGNLFPITSAYWWKGALEHEGEWVSILKTLPDRWATVRDKSTEIHPYEIPCIWKMEVDANQAYRDWVASELG
jgi:periplasmic divalent cation tolerance protein